MIRIKFNIRMRERNKIYIRMMEIGVRVIMKIRIRTQRRGM
jgi:hypothetical protein